MKPLDEEISRVWHAVGVHATIEWLTLNSEDIRMDIKPWIRKRSSNFT